MVVLFVLFLLLLLLLLFGLVVCFILHGFMLFLVEFVLLFEREGGVNIKITAKD